MKRLLACSLLILGAPIIAAVLHTGESRNAPLVSSAFAGHTLGGGYCQCGCPGCICDPGEQLEMCLPDRKEMAAKQAGTPAQPSQSDVPAAALFVGTGLLIWKRIRR